VIATTCTMHKKRFVTFCCDCSIEVNSTSNELFGIWTAVIPSYSIVSLSLVRLVAFLSGNLMRTIIIYYTLQSLYEPRLFVKFNLNPTSMGHILVSLSAYTKPLYIFFVIFDVFVYCACIMY